MAAHDHAAPILMYHRVGARIGDRPDRFLNVDPPTFSRQMRVLRHMGYDAVTFAKLVDGWNGKAALPRKPVCITFDDGLACVHEHAAPILTAMRWPATVFVPSAFIGGSADWFTAHGREAPSSMTAAQCAELIAKGWEMSGHCRTHPHLSRLSDADALAEIRVGADELRALVGCRVRTFCYPYGDLGAQTPRLVREAGLEAACTIKSGMARSSGDRYRLPRVKIAYRDGIAGMLYRLLIRARMR